jgi:hypothetical protein
MLFFDTLSRFFRSFIGRIGGFVCRSTWRRNRLPSTNPVRHHTGRIAHAQYAIGEVVQSSFSHRAVAVRSCLFVSPLLGLLNPLELVLNLILKLQKHSFYLRDLIL